MNVACGLIRRVVAAMTGRHGEFMEMGAGGWDCSPQSVEPEAENLGRQQDQQAPDFSHVSFVFSQDPTAQDGAAHMEDKSSLLPAPKPARLTLATSPNSSSTLSFLSQPEKALLPQSPGGVSFRNPQYTYVCRVSRPWSRTPSQVLEISSWTS